MYFQKLQNMLFLADVISYCLSRVFLSVWKGVLCMYKVDKGIDVPLARRKENNAHEFIEKLDSGDSFEVDTGNKAAYFRHTARELGYKAVTRSTPGGKHRVWIFKPTGEFKRPLIRKNVKKVGKVVKKKRAQK